MSDNNKIIVCAEELLKNTTNTHLRQTLNSFVRSIHEDVAPEDPWLANRLKVVLHKVCEDGYDISGFGLCEIPHCEVFCFKHKDSGRAFNVYTHNNHFDGTADSATVGYFGKKEGSVVHECEAPDIKTALQLSEPLH